MQQLIGIIIAFFILSAVFLVIEKLWPANKTQKIFRGGYKTDLIYWLFTPLVTKGITLVGMAIVLGLMFHVPPKELKSFISHRHTWADHAPVILQAVLLLLVGEFTGYWIHRWFHSRKLWKFHAIHHCSEELDWLSSVRLHPVNELVQKVIQAAVLIGLGFKPDVVAVYVPFLLFYAILLHANVSWGFGWLGHFISSPRFHRWHHTSQEEGLDKNFAGLFPWIDRIFGTYYMPKDRLPEKFGVYGEEFPQGFWGQMMYPFRKRKKKKIVTVAIVAFLLALSSSAHAIHPPPARILDAQTSPACVTVVPAFWLNKTLSKYTGGQGPAVAVKNTCEKNIIITEVLQTVRADVEKAAVPQLALALHSDESGYHGAFMVETGEDCAAPLEDLRNANKTSCKNVMLTPGETLTMPMEWGHGFTVNGHEENAEDKKISVQGVLVDPTAPFLSITWLIKAAQRGDKNSQLELASLYAKEGATQDLPAAVKWWTKAAEQGMTLAQARLARAYDTGKGAAQDFAKAAEWYEKAAAAPDDRGEAGLGVVEAKCRLGTMYAEGIGVKQDDARAMTYWGVSAVEFVRRKPAAEKGDAQEQLALGNLLRPNMPCHTQANAEAAKWYQKSAEQGVTDAEYYIGRIYESGDGVPRSDKEALKWYAKAVAKGHPQAEYQLGLLFARAHDGFQPDLEKSLKWMTLAGYQGHTLAAYHLAHLYATGTKGVKQDDVEALFWYSVPMKFEDRLETRPGMNDIGVWRLSVLDPYADQREKVKGRLTKEQQQAVKQRIIEWKPKTPEQSAGELKP